MRILNKPDTVSSLLTKRYGYSRSNCFHLRVIDFYKVYSYVTAQRNSHLLSLPTRVLSVCFGSAFHYYYYYCYYHLLFYVLNSGFFPVDGSLLPPAG